MEEKPYRTFSIAVKNADYDEVNKLFDNMSEYLSKGYDVPGLIIQRFFTLISTPDILEKQFYKNKVLEIANKADQHFSNISDYNYHGDTDKIIPKFQAPPDEDENINEYRKRMDSLIQEDRYEKYSIKDMCLNALASWFKAEPLIEAKKEGLIFLHNQINSYSQCFSILHKEQFGFYQKVVVTGFIANEIGLINHKAMPVRNKKLYDMCKDDLEEFNPKKQRIRKK